MSSATPAVVWFRDDLRLADNPALHAAAASGAPVLCVYVFDEESRGVRPLGGASRWWLHHSLAALDASLRAIGGRLDILRGAGAETIAALARGARRVDWTRRYGVAEIAIDTEAKSALKELGVEAASHNGQLLREPWELRTGSGSFYRVFTPFWRAANALPAPAPPSRAPKSVAAADWPAGAPNRIALDDLGLLPTRPDWASGLRAAWTPGEEGARARLKAFVGGELPGYAKGRDQLAEEATSRLSPHLRFGEISPRQVVAAVRKAAHAGANADKFLAEIGWREFCYHLLYHSPDLSTRNFQPRFDALPWRSDQAGFDAWKRGRTGYPVVDAGMRELWATGTMHNRARMVCASFLTKHLLIDWREGERWFWDTLCDADPANNPAQWQWVAGSGADAAPYFRVFNPVVQGGKFDPDGAYARLWAPELAKLDNKHIHAPWTAPPRALADAGVRLGETYPRPIVDHATARARALAAFATTTGEADP